MFCYTLLKLIYKPAEVWSQTSDALLHSAEVAMIVTETYGIANAQKGGVSR